MRFRRGRMTALTAVAVMTSFLFLTGCKSGTNLVPLPKMPSMSWGKKKPGTELARNGNLAPPSETALANQNGEAPLYANRTYPDTRLPAAQPGTPGASPYGQSPSYASATSPRGGQPYRQPDYYSPSPAYAGAGQSAGSGVSRGYEPYRPNYDRTATRPNAPGTTGYGSPSSPYGDTYSPTPSSSPYQGSSLDRNGGSGAALPNSTPGRAMPSHNDGSYPLPANYESKMGATSRDRGLNKYGDPGRYGGSTLPAAADGAIRLAKGGPNDDRRSSAAPAGTCTSESCSVPATASQGRYDRADNASWRPGGTSDFDAGQWSPESTRTATRQPSTLSSGYGARAGSTAPEQPSGGDYPYSDSQPSRDSGFGSSGTYR